MFLDSDLDGAGCYVVAKQLLTSARIQTKTTKESRFRNDILEWLKTDSFSNYDKVFVCDLDLNRIDCDLIDLDNVIVFSHRKEYYTAPTFKHAKLVCKSVDSCTHLLQQHLDTESSKLTTAQKLLVVYINDYDTYTLKFPISQDLNTVFYSLKIQTRLQDFYNLYKDGFVGFNDHQQNIIKFHKLKVSDTINNLTYHKALIPLQNSTEPFYCVFADYGINEVAQHVITKFKDASVALVVSLERKTVSFRRAKTSTVNLQKLAQSLCDGDGREDTAGGTLTDKFLSFSKKFVEVS